MECSQPASPGKAREPASICQELNLDIARLDDEGLFENPTYMRLYNIVKGDMSRNDLAFRKNLIRQLYFLLQITPIIRNELREKFLAEVEKMYNLNDHKKIDLTSNKMNNLLSIVHSRKQSTHSTAAERPKSGMGWNTSIPSFLRPYTATRPKGTKTARPESSKFNTQSTKVSILDDVYIKQFTTNIQEELEISKDFINKHRTSHPEYEPVYEQLYTILKAIEGKEPERKPEVVKPAKGLRYPKSAVTRHKQENWTKPEADRQSEHLNTEEHQQQDLLDQKEDKDEAKLSDNESSEEQEYLYVNQEVKPYKPYSKTIKIEEQTPEIKNNNEYFNKYAHLVGNKLVKTSVEDYQLAQGYIKNARGRSGLKREMNRRNESRRLMSAKTSTQPGVKYHKLTPHNKENEEKTEKTEKMVDLTKDPLGLPPNKISTHPTYNRRDFLKNLYEQDTKQFKKRNNIGYVHSTEPKAKPLTRPLTSVTRFHSPVRFDPLSPENVKQYNAEMLEEIEKIKSKMGGKCYASTQSLMKALSVPDASREPEEICWQTKNPFYNMVSQGRKKLKKKGRKGLKLQKKKVGTKR